jgi:hypothetical protein
MADAAIFIGWNRPVAGREVQAAAFFKECLNLYGAFQKEGKIESFEPVLLSAHGGDLNGFVLLRGDVKKLGDLRQDERFIDLTLKGTMLVGGWGAIPAYINQGIEHLMTRYQTLATAK